MALRSVRNSAALRRRKILDVLGVDVIIDVGANRGQYALELRRGGYTGRIVSFEPQQTPFECAAAASAADPHWSVHRMALGSGSGTGTINVANASGFSSMLELESSRPWWLEESRAHYVDQEEVELAALDDIVGDFLADDDVVGLKMDVQGFEGEVLRGATDLLERVVYVETESCLDDAYVNQTSADELVQTLTESGFRIASTEHGHIDEQTGIVGWLDLTFIRSAAAGAAIIAKPG